MSLASCSTPYRRGVRAVRARARQSGGRL